jgi:hypothetical protein
LTFLDSLVRTEPLTLRVTALKNGSGKVDEWEQSRDSQTYRWISQDCLLKAEGYRFDDIDKYEASYIPYIDIFWIGQTKPIIGIKPFEKSIVDIGEFYTAIIDRDCVTLIGSDGLVQLSFGAGNKSRGRGCSKNIGANPLVDEFCPGVDVMLHLQQRSRQPTESARKTELWPRGLKIAAELESWRR